MTFINKQKVCFFRWGISSYAENLHLIKNLRKTYKNFPYLYSYDEIEERDYHDAYMTAGERLDAFVAIHDGKLIGISIGCPLIHGITICADLIETELNQGKPYYFGDIIVDKNYWGLGIANTLYQKHLNYVADKGYSDALALLVERRSDDPRKPTEFKKSRLWEFHGFNPTEFTITYPWNTFTTAGEIKQEPHSLRAYQKALTPKIINEITPVNLSSHA